VDRRQRENAETDRRYRLREDLPLPELARGYYPGAKPIAMKVMFRKSDGRLLGAQALGEDGVDKRVSVLAAMLQMGATIYDLEEAELCYAPQYGSAKDPVNFAAWLRPMYSGRHAGQPLESARTGFLLDVREPMELSVENVPGAVNIPLGQLRARLKELPRDREIHVICRSAQRAYYATRILLQPDSRPGRYRVGCFPWRRTTCSRRTKKGIAHDRIMQFLENTFNHWC